MHTYLSEVYLYVTLRNNNYRNVCVDAFLKQLTVCHESSCVQIVAFSWPVQRCRVTWVFYPCGGHNESNISTPGPSSLLTIQLLLVVVVLVSYYSSVSRVACRVAFVRRLSLPACMYVNVRAPKGLRCICRARRWWLRGRIAPPGQPIKSSEVNCTNSLI